MKNSRSLVWIIVCLLMLALVLAGCGQSAKSTEQTATNAASNDSTTSSEAQKPSGPVRIGLPPWPDAEAIVNLAKIILEDKLGQEVKIVTGDPTVLWQGMAKGDIDVYPESWLPISNRPHWKEFGDYAQIMAVGFSNVRLGLVVPKYITEVNSLEDLIKYKDKFKGQIIGIDPGSELNRLTSEAIEAYGLDFKLVESSSAGMAAAFKSAIEKNEWVVGATWNPHWLFAKYDLKYLNDPKFVYGIEETSYIVARRGFEKDNPTAFNFFRYYSPGQSTANEIMLDVVNGKSSEQAAMDWYNANQNLVKYWLP